MAALYSYPSRAASDSDFERKPQVGPRRGTGSGKQPESVSFARRIASSASSLSFSSLGIGGSTGRASGSTSSSGRVERREASGAGTGRGRSKSNPIPGSFTAPNPRSTRSTSATMSNPKSSAPASTPTPAPTPAPTSAPTQTQSMSRLEEQLFTLSKIPLGDFESIMVWIESHPTADLHVCREKMLWQTYKTFERLLKRDFEERHVRLVQEFANQCVQTFAVLDYTRDCGIENGRRYVRNLVLTPEMARMNYLSKMMSLPPQERLDYITRPVPSHLEKLKWFCLLYDHLYEKIEQETRHRMEKTLLNKFQTRLETVQARLSRGANTLLTSPTAEVGRAF